MATYTGDEGHNAFVGTIGNDSADGRGGNDTLNGYGGFDTLDGGSGADLLVGGAGDDVIYSHDWSRGLSVDIAADVDTLSGGEGNDRFFAGFGDFVDGGVGGEDRLSVSFRGAAAGVNADFRDLYTNDSVTIGGAIYTDIEHVEFIEGSEFDDFLAVLVTPGSEHGSIYGLGGNDHLLAGKYVTEMHGGDGNDLLDNTQSNYGGSQYGDAGDDTILGGRSTEQLYGGIGNDHLQGNDEYDGLYGELGDDTLDGGEYDDGLVGGEGNDTLYGGNGADSVRGGNDNDLLHGDYSPLDPFIWGGTDTLRGGTGSDTLHGEAADDLLCSADDLDAGLEQDALYGGDGNDLLSIGYGDHAHGGAGADALTINFASLASGISLDWSAVAAGSAFTLGGGTIQDVEKFSRLIGTQAADSIVVGATWSGTLIEGGAGNDGLTALGNLGKLYGQDGNDQLRGGAQSNYFDGGLGVDTVDYRSATGAVTVSLATLLEQNTVGAGLDTLKDVEYLIGSDFADKLYGNQLGNHLTGDDGADSLNGNDGADTLQGDAGADRLTGGLGDDVYILTDLLDTLVEAVNGGVDEVRLLTGGGYTLADNIEKLTVLASGTFAVSGNAIANVITGNNNGGVLNGLGGNDRLLAGVVGTQLNGGVGNDTLEGKAGRDTLAGGLGDDHYYIGYGDQILESAGEGLDRVYSALSHTLGVALEDLTLLGNTAINGAGNAAANRVTGNGAANALNGADGDDTLDGGAGYDTLNGGNGNDTYVVSAGDQVNETSTGGLDLVQASLSYTLGNYLEKLTLLGTSNLNATGNSLANTLIGNGGANTLDGRYGADAMAGGLGNDTYVVDNISDQVIEVAAGGLDSVQSSVTFKLGTEVEKLVLLGSSSINGYGNTLANTLVGNTGANVLNGGIGADTLSGGLGNDSYVVDDMLDYVLEISSGGVDSVQSFVSHTLDTYVERLTLLGTANLDATGNTSANTLIGNSGINLLDGGAGADYMAGGSGNDSYVVDNAGDQVSETSTGGVDLVQSSISYTLGANVEKLTLIDYASVNGYGNALANTLIGNYGDNVLNGGLGADAMAGKSGADTYIVDNVGDQVIETPGGIFDYDTVQALISYTLSANVENLTLLGSGNLNATGNALENTLIGNSGTNVLNGGLGHDQFTGGGGADTFVLGSLDYFDISTDFSSPSDTIRISQAGIRIGDGDTVVDGAVTVAGPGGFSSTAEFIVVTKDIVGDIFVETAAPAIGSATSAYAIGRTALFMVDNGSDSVLYRFTAADNDAMVETHELRRLLTLENTASTTTSDLVFGA